MALKQLHIIIVTAFCMVALVINVNLIQSQHSIQQILLLNQTYNFQIYKGFLTGNFKFEYNDITYTGKATNGILDYCDHETITGFHGKLKSNSSSKTVSVAEINNGNRTFVFDGSIELQTVIVTMPLFRFPLIGK